MYIYVCRPGDSLPRLDRRFGLAPGTVGRLNGLSDPRRLTPGLALLLPVGSDAAGRAMELWALPAAGTAVSVLEALAEESSFIVAPALSADALSSLDNTGDDPFLKAARLGGALPLLGLSNLSPAGNYTGLGAHALLSDSEAADKLISQAVEVCESRGFRGLCIDFQYLPPFDKALWERFYAMAAEKLHKAGLLLAVCLMGVDSESRENSLPLAGQDAFAAAKYADRLLIRIEDASPLPEYEKLLSILEHWDAQDLPMFKTVLCISCFAANTPVSRPEAGSRRLSMGLGGDMACALGRQPGFDSASGCAEFEYAQPSVGSCRLRFADLRGLERILALVRRYDMAGLGLWGAESVSGAGLALCADRLNAEKLF